MKIAFVRGLTWMRVLLVAVALAWIAIVYLSPVSIVRVYGAINVVLALVAERGLRRLQARDRYLGGVGTATGTPSVSSCPRCRSAREH